MIGLHREVDVLSVTIKNSEKNAGMTSFQEGEISPLDTQWISVAGVVGDYLMIRHEINSEELREYFEEVSYTKAVDDHHRFVWTFHRLGLLTQEQIEHPDFESYDGPYELVIRPRLNECIDEVARVLSEQRGALERVASALLSRQSLERHELDELLGRQTS